MRTRTVLYDGVSDVRKHFFGFAPKMPKSDPFHATTNVPNVCWVWQRSTGGRGLCKAIRWIRWDTQDGMDEMRVGVGWRGLHRFFKCPQCMLTMMYVRYGNKRAPAHDLVVSLHAEVYIYPHPGLVSDIFQRYTVPHITHIVVLPPCPCVMPWPVLQLTGQM